ncbi:MAG: apolipoprotein N-acyltransferase [Myxococcales bacterium]|nr:apolipoprotein N-acyltransferase [Myxococcales bacterium]MCB9525501.1 apolipoprotein N-acyltransferase [Myxococcales bacterium]
MTEPRRGGRLRDLGLITVGAVLTFMSFPTAWAPDLNLFWLIWFSHVPILWALQGKAPRAAFGWGLLAGTLINGGGYYWIAGLLQTFGHLPLPVAALGLLLHSLQLGLIWGLWAWAMARVSRDTAVSVDWSAPVLMVAFELVVPRIFPAYMGNSQFPFTAVMQICDLFGITAVTFLIYRVNAVLYLWARARWAGDARPVRASLITVGLLAATLGYGAVQIHRYDAAVAAAPKLKIGMVEGDVGIFERETAERRRNHLLIQQNLSAKLEAEGAELIVWPESGYRAAYLPRDAARFPPAQTPLVAHFRDDIRQGTSRADRELPIRGFKTPLLFGATSRSPSPAPRWEGDINFIPRNTAWLLDGDGTVAGVYDKVYLLVMGEYVPFAKHIPWIFKMIPAAGNLEPGAEVKVIEADLWPDKGGPIRFGVLICYEGLLPGFTRQFGPQKPHLFVNITNDDWFGASAERWLHLVLTIPRAIEHRVPLVRSTLTGVSTFVDPLGRLHGWTDPAGAETLLRDVALMQSTTVYQTIGDSFPIGCSLLGLVWLILGARRRRRAAPA